LEPGGGFETLPYGMPAGATISARVLETDAVTLKREYRMRRIAARNHVVGEGFNPSRVSLG